MLECLLWTQPGTKAAKFRSSKCFPVCTSKQTQCVLPLAPSNGAREGHVLMILRCAIARVMKAKRPFGAHVCFTPKTGVRADIPGPPVWANSCHPCLATQRSQRMDAPAENCEGDPKGLASPGYRG